MDLWTSIITIGVFAFGWIMGRLARPFRKQSKAKCTCDHMLSFHDDKGKCHYSWWSYRTAHGIQLHCGCHQYDGPRPLESYLPSDIKLPEVKDN